VAMAKAAVVCPDGKEKPLTSIFLSISLDASKGLSRLITNFIPVVTASAVNNDTPVIIPLFVTSYLLVIIPAPIMAKGVAILIAPVELAINRKVPSNLQG